METEVEALKRRGVLTDKDAISKDSTAVLIVLSIFYVLLLLYGLLNLIYVTRAITRPYG